MALLTDTPYRASPRRRRDAGCSRSTARSSAGWPSRTPPLLRGLLPAIESVSGTIKGIERDREKLLAVGGLAAGLAHELNNPAAAAARGVATLRGTSGGDRPPSPRSRRPAPRRSSSPRSAPRLRGDRAALRRERLDPIAESDREQELVGDARGGAASRTPSRSPPPSPEAGLGAEWVDRVAAGRRRRRPRRRPALRGGVRRHARPAGRAGGGDDPHRRPRRRRQELLVPRPGAAPERGRPRGPREHALAAGPQARASGSRSSATSTPGCRASRRRAPSSTRSGRT